MPLIKRVVALLNENMRNPNLKNSLRRLLEKTAIRLNDRRISGNAPFTTDQIFANHFLNFRDVKVVGFDLDYTLVPYTVDLQDLIYRMARDVLINAYGYPADLKFFAFDPHFAVRGLSVDGERGIICKLSHLQRLSGKRTYRGKQPLSLDQIEEIYGETRHISHEDLSKMRPLHDLFSVAEACLIADAVEYFENNSRNYVPSAVVDDVQGAIRDVHVSGSMQKVVSSQPDRYIKASPHLADTLLHLRNSGKKLFLCTNSNFSYTNKALGHALGISSSSGVTDWKQLFDVIICSANKPDFFSTGRPFRRWLLEGDRPDTSPVGSLGRGEVYVQGSAKALRRATSWKGQDILYVGDNLRTDLVEARRRHGWHTACVIDELEQEMSAHNSQVCQELRLLRSSLRHLIQDVQDCLRRKEEEDDADGGGGSSIDGRVGGDRSGHAPNHSAQEELLLVALEQHLQRVNSQFSSLFNQHFGSMFRTDGHPSLFAFMLLRYGDLYMSDVTQFRSYSAQHRFYPHHALHMAHDPDSLVL